MDFKKELGKKNRENFISEVNRLLDINIEHEYDPDFDKNPYRIYIKIPLNGRIPLLTYCREHGYKVEDHIKDWAWITFDYKKMKSWYARFNANYHENLRLFMLDEKKENER